MQTMTIRVSCNVRVLPSAGAPRGAREVEAGEAQAGEVEARPPPPSRPHPVPCVDALTEPWEYSAPDERSLSNEWGLRRANLKASEHLRSTSFSPNSKIF